MARKRVSEEELLRFREQAGELAEVVGEKYERMDRLTRQQQEPVRRETGFLLLHDVQSDAQQLRPFAQRAREAGYSTEVVEVLGYREKDPFDRTPQWQRRLEQAQTGLQQISRYAKKVVVLGVGDSCPLAALIAEQYPVEGLVVVGGGLKNRPGSVFSDRASARLSSLARNNLFSVVCPVLALVPEECGRFTPRSASLYQTNTRSDRVEVEPLPGTDVRTLWTEREQSLEERIFAFAEGL